MGAETGIQDGTTRTEAERDSLRDRLAKLETLGAWIERERLHEIDLAMRAQDAGDSDTRAREHYARADGLKFAGYRLNELAGRDLRTP